MNNFEELETLYNLVVERADTSTNPRYAIIKQKDKRVRSAILSEIKRFNPDYDELDYEDEIYNKIVELIDEYCLDAFAKGIEFERTIHNQTGAFANKDFRA